MKRRSIVRKIIWLARREYKASVRTKGFIIGLIIAPLIFSGSGLAFYLLKDRVDTTDKRVAVIDHSELLADVLIAAAEERNTKYIYDEETGKKNRPAYLIKAVQPNRADPQGQRLELSDRIRRGELHAFIEIGPDVLHPGDDPERYRISYYAKNAAIDNLRGWIERPINNHLRHLRLTEAGVDESSVGHMLTWLGVEGLGLVSVDTETGQVKDARRSSEAELILTPIAIMMLMYLILMMTTMPLLSSVMEEKSQRIAEVLLGSVQPFEFMAGKIAGGIAVSLTVAAVYLIGGIFTLRFLGLNDYIPYHVLPWFFAFLMLAIVMYGSIFASLGSACNNAKDAQSLTFPAMLPLIISWFVFMPVLQEPTTSFATWISLFPLCTPMLMLIRVTSPVGIPAWQPWVGLAGVLLTTLLAIWAGGRIFRVGILMQGTPPKISKLVRWAIKG
jgi:ABC-2 type transport system permease protein